jgi:hypothetical protein
MFKEIEVPYLTQFDEPSIQIVRPGYNEKYANLSVTSDILKGLEDFTGKPGKSYMLVTAVSPVEYWGDNKNHDAFEEHWLKKNHGTFCTDGTFFKNHVNKDPTKNYGDNELSWYDDKMKRVLVLVGVDHNKAPDIVQDLEAGKRLSVSMGCRVAHDTCSICGNKAPTRNDYCPHMKNNAGKILPDGRKVFCYNPDPRFFDLSKVIRPAGHIEYIVKVIKPKVVDMGADNKIEENMDEDGKITEKAASVGGAALFEENQDFADKFANLKKISIINKIVSGEPVSEEDMPSKMQDVIRKSKDIVNISDEEMDDDTISGLSEHPLKDILTTGRTMGIDLKLPEISRIMIIKVTRKDPEMTGLLDKLDSADCPYADLATKGPISTMLDRPEVLKVFNDEGLLDDKDENIKEAVVDLMSPYFEKRSHFREMSEKRAFFQRRGSQLKPKVVSDSSGTEYLTTEDALDRAGDANLVRNVAKAGLGAGALGYASWLANRVPLVGGKYLMPAAWLGTGVGLKKLYDYMDQPQLQVHPDVAVQKIGALLKDNGVSNLEKTAQDPMYTMNTGMMGMPPESQWVTNLKSLGNYAKENPAMATFLGLLGLGAAGKGISAAGKGIKSLGRGLKNTKDMTASGIEGLFSHKPKDSDYLASLKSLYKK